MIQIWDYKPSSWHCIYLTGDMASRVVSYTLKQKAGKVKPVYNR